MKKIIAATVAATAFCFGAVACFVACGDDRASGENSLRYNVRYIEEYDIHADKAVQDYYVFYSDGTGKYYRAWHKTAEDIHTETITFKYAFFGEDKSDLVGFFIRSKGAISAGKCLQRPLRKI